MGERLSDKIIGNTFFAALGYVWDILVLRLLLLPYIVYKLGMRDFSVWAIISMLVGYFSFMGFSVDSAFVKYISQHFTQRDHRAINCVINTGLVFYSILGAAIVAVILLAAKPILGFFELADHASWSFLVALKLSSVAFLVLCLVRVFESVLDGLQRMGLTNGVRMAVGVPYAILTVLFLHLGMGVRGLALRDLCVFTIQLVAVYCVAKKALPELRVNPFRHADWPTFSRLFRFGIKMHANTVCGMINYSVDKLLIGRLVDPGQHGGMVGSYEIGGKVNYMARFLPGVMVAAVVPAAAELDAREQADGLVELASRGTKYLALTAAPIMALVYVGAPHLMAAWMGDALPLSVCTSQLLAAGYFAWCVSGGVSRVAVGMGKPEILLKMSFVALVINVGLSLGLLLAFGYPGAPLGTTIASVLSTVLMWRMFLGTVGGSLLAFMKESCLPAVASGLAAAFAVSFGMDLAGVEVFPGRLANLGVLAVEGVALGLVYGVLVYWAGGIDQYDLDLARRTLARIRHILGRPASDSEGGAA